MVGAAMCILEWSGRAGLPFHVREFQDGQVQALGARHQALRPGAWRLCSRGPAPRRQDQTAEPGQLRVRAKVSLFRKLPTEKG